LSLPPFNHEFHWLFSFFPLLSLIILIPLFFFSIQTNTKRAVAHTYLYSLTAAMGQYYWIGFDMAEGLWHLVIIGLVLISGFIALFYLACGMLFRFCYYNLSRWYIPVFPAIWILIDYSRSLSDISFPWSFLGYSLTPLLPFAQTASVTGVWGLTYIIVLMNVLLYELARSYYLKCDIVQKWIHVITIALGCLALSIWGWQRMNKTHFDKDYKISLVQSNLNMLKWGNRSLDTSFTIAENMVYEAAQNKPDIIIMPESALLCYLIKRPVLANRVKSWADSIKIPLILGGLNWEKAPVRARYDYFVYNTAFLVKPFKSEMEMYYKIKLVPFSEAMPFEANFPILSRVNLGEADFQRGTINAIFDDGSAKLRAAPFICYEIIYPGFVQKRLREGKANLIVNITNDGWFGNTSGPFQHAMMSRLRTIENGVPLVRCANSGISMIVNQYGVVEKKTSLYVRSVLNGEVALSESSTIYSRYGDWFVLFCGVIVMIAIASSVYLNFASSKNKSKQ